MPGIILVDRNRSIGAGDGLKRAPDMARRLRSRRTFTKKQNIGGNFCSRIALERSVRQPYRAQQVGMFRQMPTDSIGLFVHGVAARDERHHAAGPQFLN